MSRQPAYTLLPPEQYKNPRRAAEPDNSPVADPDERQELGSIVSWRKFWWRKVGECQIRRALEGEPSNRTPKRCKRAAATNGGTSGVFGALHFVIQFTPNGKTLLKSVTVRIRIESVSNTASPTEIFHWRRRRQYRVRNSHVKCRRLVNVILR